jgi:hypothetical protein
MHSGPVPAILALQQPEGWWDNPQYATKPLYTSTSWQLMYLAELAADPSHPGIRRAVELVLDTVQTPQGDFPAQGSKFHKFKPTDMLCNGGMNIWALLRLGPGLDDPRIRLAVDFLAESALTTNLECRFNGEKMCAWAAAKTLRALAEIHPARRSEKVQTAIHKIADLLLDKNLARADYPIRPDGKVSQHWFKLGFPRSYQSDILQCMVIFADLGMASDPRLQPAIQFLIAKSRPDGVCRLEETIQKMPVQFETKNKPSKWLTWQALYVLKAAGCD